MSHTRAFQHYHRKPILKEKLPRHSSCNARTHHEICMCDGLAHLDYESKTRAWNIQGLLTFSHFLLFSKSMDFIKGLVD